MRVGLSLVTKLRASQCLFGWEAVLRGGEDDGLTSGG